MTGANGAADRGARPGRWDLALSFAGVQRDYVGQVAQSPAVRGGALLYDAGEQIELWGKYLALSTKCRAAFAASKADLGWVWWRLTG
jgi:hypothetical protein